MMKGRGNARKRWVGWTVWGTMGVLLVTAIAADSQTAKKGIVRPYTEVNFPQDADKPKCLQFFLENGDLEKGPSTAIMKAGPNCDVAPHYHTAEEQLIVVRGEVSTGMEGMGNTLLGAGGFAMMPSKQVHWFSCTAKEECVMFVTFDRAYDIVWVKDKK